MSTITTTGSGNWSSTTPDAPWPSGTKPTTGDTVVIAAGHTVTLDEDTATLGAAGISGATANGVLVVSGTRTINGAVSYSSTNASGFIQVPTGTNLTINGQASNSGSGYTIVTAGTAVLSVSNPGGTAVNGSNAYVINSAGTGAVTITGDVVSSFGYAIFFNSSSASHVITGNVSASGNATGGIFAQAGTIDIIGNLSCSNLGSGAYGAMRVSGSTVKWTGSRTLSAATDCFIVVTAGALQLATSTSALTLANSGRFSIRVASGATLTTSAAGGTAAINQQSSTAQAAILGVAASIINPYGGGSAVYPTTDQVDGDVTYGPNGADYTGTGVNATTIRAALGLASANLDTQLALRTGYKLASDGLDAISAAEPTTKPTSFAGWLMWLVQTKRRASKTPTTLLVKTEAGATITSQNISDDGAGTASLGAPS